MTLPKIRRSAVSSVPFLLVLLGAVAAAAAAPRLTYAYLQEHLHDDAASGIVVAKVQDDPITLREVGNALSRTHAGFGKESTVARIDFAPIIDRAIAARLISMEARDMGLDQTPEFKASVEEYRSRALIEAIQQRATVAVKADPVATENLYKNLVREWKIRSFLVTKKEDADKFAASLKAGKSFDALVKQAVADKKGRGGEPAGFLPRPKLYEPVEAVLRGLKKNQWSAPVQVPGGFALVRWEDERFPEDPVTRVEAEQRALNWKKKEVLTQYYADMVKRFAKVDQKLVDSLDYEAKLPGLEAMKKDDRVLASFEGAAPLKVSELSETLEASFFHGLDRAVSEKKANVQKMIAFDALVSRRILPLEVARLRIAEGPEFTNRMTDHVNGALFSKYMEMVVVPGLKLDEAASKSYFERHKKDFTYPPFYTLESLAFVDVKSAQSALTKLQAKTDLKWLTANADGQIKLADRKLDISGVLSGNGIPADLAAILATAKKDDYRLYSSAEGQHYVIHVMDVTPSKVQPYEEAKDTIKERLLPEQIELALKDQSARLRKAHPVTMFVEQGVR